VAHKNHLLQLIEGAVQVPQSQNLGSVKLWCDYAIWGLLFYDDQSPWLTLVECIHICFDQKRKHGRVFPHPAPEPSGEHEPVVYCQPLNHPLRHLIFRDSDVARIAATRSADDRARWTEWLAGIAEFYPNISLDYLQKRFSTFGEMARSVELLRSIDIEPHSPKRWTSHHLLPLGPTMLFPDVNEADSPDRKFMRRTGEMLYLMLNRSVQRDCLEPLIDARLLRFDGVWNRLAARLAAPADEEKSQTCGYLPVARHQTFNRLAEDWIALLSLDRIPIENVLDPLQRVSGLFQILYILERAQEVVGDGVPVAPFFLDLVGAPGNNPIRKLSANQYKRHRTLPMEATASFVERFEGAEEWTMILASDAGAELASRTLRDRFLWGKHYSSDPDRRPSPRDQLAELKTEAQATKGHSIVATLNNHLRQIGMLRALRRSGTWYAPSDALLEALVLANVTVPMEFTEFLDRLLRRYNIAIGPEEVRKAFQVSSGALPAPMADLKENERRLEERLRVLGFLDRKSDDCAFVINPFFDTEPVGRKAATSG
jgi:hypothetical protein